MRALGADVGTPDGVGDEPVPDLEVRRAVLEPEIVRVQHVVGRGEGLRALAVVGRARFGVAGLELQSLAQPAIQLQHQPVVLRVDQGREIVVMRPKFAFGRAPVKIGVVTVWPSSGPPIAA